MTASATRSIPTCVSGSSQSPKVVRIRPQAGRITSRIALGLLLLTKGGPSAATELQGPPTSYPLCTASQLAGFPWTHRAYGKSIPGIALRNMSLSICRIVGFPELRAYTDAGKSAAIQFERRPFIDTKIFAYTVTPGSAVFFTFYGQAPSGEFDRSCVGITQLDIVVTGDRRPIDVTISSGTCGGRMFYSQIFPVSELAAPSFAARQYDVNSTMNA